MEAYKDEEWLRHEYVERGRNGTDIADECGVHHQNIYYYLDKFDIEKRSRGGREGDKNPAWKGGDIEVECPACGNEFEAKRHRVKSAKHGPFCSRSCMYEHRSVHNGGENNPLYNVDPEDAPCYGRTGEDHPMFGVRGEDHHNWKGEYDREFRDTSEWEDARRETFEQDGDECADCGIGREQHRDTFGRDLEIHHITPVSDGGAKLDTDNLTPLCMACHHQRHREL